MNTDAFFNEWNGKQITAYGGECVALIAQYLDENGLHGAIAYANAVDWFTNPAPLSAFTKVVNIPTDYSQVPSHGDIMVWGSGLPGSGGFGHVSIYDAKTGPGVFRSFDQNWGGPTAHYVSHTYDYILGWFTRTVSAPAQSSGGDEMIANTDQATKIYGMLRPNSGGSPSEIAATAGKRSFAGFLNDAQAEVSARDSGLRDQAAQLSNMQNSINQLNQTVTTISQARDAAIADGGKTKADLVKLMADEQPQLAQIAKLTSDLSTAHDTITDLQKVKPVDEQQVVQNVFIRFWKSLFK